MHIYLLLLLQVLLPAKRGNTMNYYQIETCVTGAKNGNKEDLIKILEQYKPFIFKTARNFNIKNYDICDLEQIGYMAVINAISRYRTGSCTFSSYAYESIKNAFRYTARQNSGHQREFSLNCTVTTNGSHTEYIDFIDSSENLEETVLCSEEASEIKKAVTKLPLQEMELVMLLYYKGISLKDYAAKKGMSYNQAARKKDFVLYKLGNQFKN
jgi:RNA polymerase sporulation-specific sigma factor